MAATIRASFAMFTMVLVSTAAVADTFTASIVLPQGQQVLPGEPLPIQIWGLLSNAAPGNGGLAYFRMDFAMSGPETITLGDAIVLGPPTDGSMDNFVRPLGYDMGYGGTAVGGELVQAGGAQNVIGNNPAKEPMVSAPSAELVVFGVAHTEQLLLEGAITFPPGAAAGSYTLSLQNLVAHALTAGQAPMPFGVYRLEPTIASAGSAVIEVLCTTAGDCCDTDSNAIRDDACTWCACEPSGCNTTSVAFADLGGSFGNCLPDGFVNLFDRNHVLTCMAGTSNCDSLNIDAGGSFGSCAPDGFCNLFDANHVLAVIAGENPCTCSGEARKASSGGAAAGVSGAAPEGSVLG